ncbi:hypothetical protein TESG_06139 [Trichophyton tonsurans CBS 112818]|uniref:Uncharacterized protein n=1 Tax=Trichophyton tonsurans (strain CBS 112818) TaxID=647933 RepID=F2S509_TRIT1|nr:hypothetical protein TESG_06139 [Trichophyton tonsurans CBS 112818]
MIQKEKPAESSAGILFVLECERSLATAGSCNSLVGFINTTRPDPQPRYRLGFIQGGALVKAWPSRDPTYPKRCGGGKWIKLATIPELDFLGLDRFQQIEASTNKIEEDAFAEKMRLIGARWQAHITQIITL